MTEMATRLRKSAGMYPYDTNLQGLLTQAADEIDRYYNGMIAWKLTAEAKDAETIRVDKEANLK